MIYFLFLYTGLCYAEFSARLPRAGSAYVYTYVTISESCAFLIGWNMILEHMIGAAVAAKAWTQHLDHLLNNTIHRWVHYMVAIPYSHLFHPSRAIMFTYLLRSVISYTCSDIISCSHNKHYIRQLRVDLPLLFYVNIIYVDYTCVIITNHQPLCDGHSTYITSKTMRFKIAKYSPVHFDFGTCLSKTEKNYKINSNGG